jgi:hypothetical protein
MSPREGDHAAAAIAAYAPASLSTAAASFARAAVARAAPQRRERAKALLYAAGRLAGFGESVGMELEAGTLLAEASVERFVLSGCPRVSAATRRTLRTNLRALARAHETPARPQPAPLPRERAKAPYSEAEIEGYLLGGESSGRRNLSDALHAALGQDAALPRLEPGRLRSTWLCECAELVGLRAFMDAAGIRCSQRLGDLVAELPGVQEAEAVALLGGSGEERSAA